jgi:hypothetical protein
MKDAQYTAKVFSNCQSKCCKAPIEVQRFGDGAFVVCKKCERVCKYENKTPWFKRLLNNLDL